MCWLCMDELHAYAFTVVANSHGEELVSMYGGS